MKVYNRNVVMGMSETDCASMLMELHFERHDEVGRCRLIVSKPELKARLVSALETEM
jgi:hypothetical protein